MAMWLSETSLNFNTSPNILRLGLIVAHGVIIELQDAGKLSLTTSRFVE